MITPLHLRHHAIFVKSQLRWQIESEYLAKLTWNKSKGKRIFIGSNYLGRHRQLDPNIHYFLLSKRHPNIKYYYLKCRSLIFSFWFMNTERHSNKIFNPLRISGSLEQVGIGRLLYECCQKLLLSLETERPT